jgi:FkbM family methyltransferase
MRLSIPFVILVMPYLALRRFSRLLLGRTESYRVFFEGGIGSTCDYLEKLKFPEIVRTWIDVRTRYSFEKEITEAVLGVRGKIFLDIGANMGYYTAILSENFETIFAFEPHPQNLAMLRSTIAAGRLHNVIARNEAVSDTDGMAVLHFQRKRGEHSIMKSQGVQQLPVRTIKLDSIVKEPVDLAKVDVEGAEWKVIKGAELSMRAGKILRWVIEVDDPSTKGALEDYLRERKYVTRWLDARHLFATIVPR